MGDKTKRNIRVQSRYDELMREGKHGHYETLFRVVREEVEAAVERERERCIDLSALFGGSVEVEAAIRRG